MRIATLCPFLFGALACGGSAKTVAPAAKSGAAEANTPAVSTPREITQTDVLAPYLATASESRELPPLGPIVGERVSREQMIAKVRAHVDAEVPPEEIEREEIDMALFGLIPPDYKYKEGFFKLLESELAGVYIPTDKRLYYSSDLGGGESETIVHELTHALHDQHFSLGDKMAALKGKGDAGFGLQVLAEGDATYTGLQAEIKKRLGAAAANFPMSQLRGLMQQGVDASMAKLDAPQAMKKMLAAPYIEGVTFVSELYQQGGWQLVNEAWKRPPTTSAQALDVQKWKSNTPWAALATPVGPKGFTLDHSETAGEFGLRMVLEQWVASSALPVEKLAGFSSGDMSALYRGGQGEYASATRVSFATSKRVLMRDLTALKGAWLPASGNFRCLARSAVGPIAISQKGFDVVFTAGPATKSDKGWSSKTTCDDAKRWHDAMK